jgi:hypothetical protein
MIHIHLTSYILTRCELFKALELTSASALDICGLIKGAFVQERVFDFIVEGQALGLCLGALFGGDQA